METLSDEENKDSYTIFSAGMFARLYFPTGKVKPFVEGYSYFGIYKEKEVSPDNEVKYKSGNNTYGGGPGIAVPIGD